MNEQQELFPRTFNIWVEGWATTGEFGLARLVAANVAGETFSAACRNYAGNNPKWAKLFRPNELTHWGCCLYDNEAQAREFFG